MPPAPWPGESTCLGDLAAWLLIIALNFKYLKRNVVTDTANGDLPRARHGTEPSTYVVPFYLYRHSCEDMEGRHFYCILQVEKIKNQRS